jgi:GAF domain-containing protein
VFVNCQPAVIKNAYEDNRFYKEVDEMTGFQTRNMICTPLLHNKDNCLGTIQSLNKIGGEFTTDDLELLNLAASMVAVAINNSRQYNELLVTNEARRKFIKHITDRSGNNFDKLYT